MKLTKKEEEAMLLIRKKINNTKYCYNHKDISYCNFLHYHQWQAGKYTCKIFDKTLKASMDGVEKCKDCIKTFGTNKDKIE
jgi:hypothetical protein